ncbi:hypothetical protein ABH930_000475 [Kitasatospora sp. GAS204A]|nr:hypothetical protein [Kitasatospora sp. GAS204B]
MYCNRRLGECKHCAAEGVCVNHFMRGQTMHQPATISVDAAVRPLATPGPAVESGLRFGQPVPRQLVHKAAIAEVLLTDTVRRGEHEFLVAAQWPRDHAVYAPSAAGLSDSLLFAETIRQSLVYLAHTYYDVPLSHRFIGSGAEFEITDPGPLYVGGEPLPVVLEAQLLWVGSRPPQRFGMRLEVVLTVGGKTCGRGALQLIAVDDKRYTMLRGRGARPAGAAVTGATGVGVAGMSAAGMSAAGLRVSERVRPSVVGRQRVKDSLLTRRSGGPWQLVVDTRHAIHFDHPSDHLPLMVAAEGFRQLGHLLVHHGGAGTADGQAGPRALVGLEVDCLAFGELGEPIYLIPRDARRASAPGRVHLEIDAVQAGRVLAASRATWDTTTRAALPGGQPVSATSSTPGS